MALNNYITIDDITNGKFKQFDDTFKQTYIDKTNSWYEAFAKNKDIAIINIEYPIDEGVKELLISKCLIFFCVDMIGGTQNTPNPQGIYQIIYAANKEVYQDALTRINTLAITGEESISASTTIFGRRVR